MAAVQLTERNQDATVYVGDLSSEVSEELLWELMLQAGPVVSVHLPKDKITQDTYGYGFVEFKSEQDADYAIHVLHNTALFGKNIRVNKASNNKRTNDIGANLFIGGLDTSVDEAALTNMFSAFGTPISNPKIMRDEMGDSKGFAFVKYDAFESSDAAIEALDGQFVAGKQISVNYAYKRDGGGERHGSMAERMLAAQNPHRLRQNTRFADRDGMVRQAVTSNASGGASGARPGGAPMPPPPSSGAQQMQMPQFHQPMPPVQRGVPMPPQGGFPVHPPPQPMMYQHQGPPPPMMYPAQGPPPPRMHPQQGPPPPMMYQPQGPPQGFPQGPPPWQQGGGIPPHAMNGGRGGRGGHPHRYQGQGQRYNPQHYGRGGGGYR